MGLDSDARAYGLIDYCYKCFVHAKSMHLHTHLVGVIKPSTFLHISSKILLIGDKFLQLAATNCNGAAKVNTQSPFSQMIWYAKKRCSLGTFWLMMKNHNDRKRFQSS